MSKSQIQQLKTLKDKFYELPSKKRESLGICFLKVKLGVNTSSELKTLTTFLQDFKMDLVPENLESMINYLHSEEHSLPEFIALEDSLNNIEAHIKTNKANIPPYNPDEVETLREGVKPFKSGK